MTCFYREFFKLEEAIGRWISFLHVLEGLKPVWIGTIFVCLSSCENLRGFIVERSWEGMGSCDQVEERWPAWGFWVSQGSQLKRDSCASDIFGVSVALWSCAFGLQEEKVIRFTLMIKKPKCNKRAASGGFTWPLSRWQNVTRAKLYFACCLQLFPWGQELALEAAVTFPSRVWEERRLLEYDCTAVFQLFGFTFPVVPSAICNTHL